MNSFGPSRVEGFKKFVKVEERELDREIFPNWVTQYGLSNGYIFNPVLFFPRGDTDIRLSRGAFEAAKAMGDMTKGEISAVCETP